MYDEARKANLTTAALLWPVTGRANIDYNLPEIFPNRPWQNQVLVSLFSGSPLYQLDLNRRFGHIRNGLSQPELDDFVLASAVHTIQTKKPNIMFVHFTDLDTQRHYHGFESNETIAAIQRHDERLGKIIQALKESDLYEESTIIALGDHSALSENKSIQLNVLFHQRGLISLNKKKIGRLESLLPKLRRLCLCICKGQNDTDTIREVQLLLEELLQNKQNGIEFILHDEAAKDCGADGNCLFMLEAREGYYFTENYTGDFIKEITEKMLRLVKIYIWYAWILSNKT